jgi:hypothetical protein
VAGCTTSAPGFDACGGFVLRAHSSSILRNGAGTASGEAAVVTGIPLLSVGVVLLEARVPELVRDVVACGPVEVEEFGAFTLEIIETSWHNPELGVD